MKKHVLLLTMLFAGLALTSCGENTSSASSSSVATSSSESTSSSNQESSTSSEKSFEFSTQTSAKAYIQDLINAVENNNFTIEYNDGEGTYQDIYTSEYATIRSEYNGYIVLDSYNSNDSLLKDKILYTFIEEDGKPVLSLPTVNSSSSGLSIARSIDDINYIKKALNESNPIDEDALTINEDGTATLKDSSYGRYTAFNDLIQIFHNSSISYWSLDKIIISKTSSTMTFDFYYSSSTTPIASFTIKNVNSSKSEVINSNIDSLKLPESGNIGYYNLNALRDNRFTTKSTFTKVGPNSSDVLGVVGSNISLNKYEFISYDNLGEVINSVSQYSNIDGEMYAVQIDGHNEVTNIDSSYTWAEYFYDFSQYLDPMAFRKTSSTEHDYEYFGVDYQSIVGGLTYSATSSYGNLRHLYADETDGVISSFTAVFEDVIDSDNVTKHVEIKIDVVEDKEFEVISSYQSNSENLEFETAFDNTFKGTTSYKAIVKSTESSTTNLTYVIYYDVDTSSLIREKYETEDGTTSLASVDGYKLMTNTSNDGITYFTYDLTKKTATARKAPFAGDLSDLQLFTTSSYLFDKQDTGEYLIKDGIYDVGSTINFDHGSAYTDDTLSFEIADSKISKAKFTITDWFSSISDEITFEYSNYTLDSDYTSALKSMTAFVTPTNWLEFDSDVGSALTSFLGSEDLAKEVPFVYTSLVDSWRTYQSCDYDDSWNKIEGTDYINIYPGSYNYSDSEELLQWLDSYNTLLSNSSSWTELESTSKGRVYSNGSIKFTVGTYVSSGLYIQKVNS